MPKLLHSRPLRFLRAHWLESVALVSLVALIVGVNPGRLLRAYAHLRPQLLLLMLAVTVAMYLVRGGAWWVTLRHLGVRIGLLRTELVEVAGQTMIFVPTGDLARAALVERHAKGGNRAPGQLIGSIAFQELLFLTIFGLGVLPKTFTQPGVVLLVLLVTAAQLGIVGLIMWRPAYDWALRQVEHIKLLRRFDAQLRQLRKAFVELLDVRVLISVLVCDVVAVGMAYLLFWLALRGVGVANATFVLAAFAISLSHVVSGLSFLPGSIGAFEGFVILLLAANGVSPGEAAAAGLLYRGFNDIVMAVLGVGAGAALRATGPSTARGRRRSRRAT